MVAGLDRYFQIARCYRDEGARHDRQPEFTQVDLELSFTSKDAVKALVESFLRSAWPRELPPLPKAAPFPTLTHEKAMERFGSDKPDLRFDNELVDLTDMFQREENPFVQSCLKTEQPCVKVISFLPEGSRYITQSQLKRLEAEVVSFVRKSALPRGGTLVASAFSVNERGKLRSSLLKRCPETITNSIISTLNLCEGSVGFLACGEKALVISALGRARTQLGARCLELKKRNFAPLWVQDFPLFEKNEGGKLVSCHHPFTRPMEEDLQLVYNDPLKARGEHYDLILNGHEVAGGSIRIHESGLQRHVIKELLGLDPSEFSHMLEALDYGCPPHGGVAVGLDRLLAIMLGMDGVREVMAFPKSSSGRDPMSEAPGEISEEEKCLYHIKVVEKKCDEENKSHVI